jgi:predicted amidohydrolase YtcJ
MRRRRRAAVQNHWVKKISVVVAVVFGSHTALAAPDLVVVNADIYTMDPAVPRAEALAVEDGRFVAVGTNLQVRALADPDTEIVDAMGKTVTPGFIDGHAHVTGDAPPVSGVDLSYIADKDEWLRLIAEADESLPEGEWLTGGWWDHTLTDSIFPTKEMLDAVVPDRPILLNHIDGHYGWANSRALEIAGVTADTLVPPGGEIVLDSETKRPTGILLEGAQGLVAEHIPELSDERRLNGLAEMYKYANSFGLTGLHQMGALEDYQYIVANGDPTLRVWYGYFGFPRVRDDYDAGVQTVLEAKRETARIAAESHKTDAVGPLLEIGYVKLINDGVLSSHTAVLIEDYFDRNGWSGEYITEPGDLARQIDKITAAGLPVAVHSIGDAAVRASLDAFEAARDNTVPYPNRIEHIEIVHPSDVPRFEELNVVASMQPNHGTNSIGYVPDRVGGHRTNRAYVWRSMLTMGIPLVFGADYATSPLNPLTQIADAMFRVSPFGFNNGLPFHPEQVLTFEEALYAYTQAGANMTPWKDEIGSVSVGKWADFVLLDGKVPSPMNEDFMDLTVQRTYLAGREVYRSED